MNPKSNALAVIRSNQREEIHKVFNAWIDEGATDDEFAQYCSLRNKVAPGKPCSVVTVVRACASDRAYLSMMPQSLRLRLQKEGLLPD